MGILNMPKKPEFLTIEERKNIKFKVGDIATLAWGYPRQRFTWGINGDIYVVISTNQDIYGQNISYMYNGCKHEVRAYAFWPLLTKPFKELLNDDIALCKYIYGESLNANGPFYRDI
jgi:hypothetical protein